MQTHPSFPTQRAENHDATGGYSDATDGQARRNARTAPAKLIAFVGKHRQNLAVLEILEC